MRNFLNEVRDFFQYTYGVGDYAKLDCVKGRWIPTTSCENNTKGGD